MKPVDDKIRSMLQEFSRALVQAISTSPEIGETLRKIRQEGYSLYVVLDCKQEEERPPRIELTRRQPPPPAEPAFRLNGNDVLFLKSLGIDPTRPAKRRRGA